RGPRKRGTSRRSRRAREHRTRRRSGWPRERLLRSGGSRRRLRGSGRPGPRKSLGSWLDGWPWESGCRTRNHRRRCWLRLSFGLGRLVVVRVVQPVVHEGMPRRLLQRSLKSLLGVFHRIRLRLRLRLRRRIAVHREPRQQRIGMRPPLKRLIHPRSTRLRPRLSVVVGTGLLVGLRLEARLDVGVDCRGELLAGVVGHVTPSSPGPSWPSSSPPPSWPGPPSSPQPS
ncbi:MAG: hypothetical protein QOH84_2216, partial [Kribbellaceae bacterium]|nr:hypothetical protein [Kribbellaceae bacterium]